jgi:beta-lactam-binding protein with PASTA domain
MRALSSAVALVLLASACGGGSDSDLAEPVPTTQERVATEATPTATPTTTVVPTTTVATTTEVALVVVPDLTGETGAYARGVLDTLGLTLYVEESIEVLGEPDVILTQLPQPGTTVTLGSS